MWLMAAVLAAATVAAAGIPCEVAQVQCAYRAGCGTALNNYMMYCNEVLSSPATTCPEQCEYALIALTSTPEGKELMNCQCKNDYCEGMKRRIEVCRSQVIRGAENATASCRLSEMICLADSECAAALEYYKFLCRSMYEGRKCSKKCRNSISILRKQEKAAPLTACRCNGDEDYDCQRMQDNIARLCVHNKHNHKGKRKKLNVLEVSSTPKPTVVKSADSVAALSYLAILVSICITFNT